MANTTGYGYLLGPAPQFFDANGKPLVGGKLFVYIAGTTTTAVTYSDFNRTENTSPVILNDLGTCMLIVPSANLYKIALYDRNGNLLLTRDNVSVSSGQQIIYTTANKVDSSDSTVDVTATTDPDTGMVTYDLSIQKEIYRAEEAEGALAEDIADETDRAAAAEKALAGGIESETQRATAAEKALAGGIEDETDRATAAEKAAKTEIVAGDNITVTKTVGADGQDVYTIAGEDGGSEGVYGVYSWLNGAWSRTSGDADITALAEGNYHYTLIVGYSVGTTSNVIATIDSDVGAVTHRAPVDCSYAHSGWVEFSGDFYGTSLNPTLTFPTGVSLYPAVYLFVHSTAGGGSGGGSGGDTGIVVFEVSYSADIADYVYPTYQEVAASVSAGKMPVLLEYVPNSPVRRCFVFRWLSGGYAHFDNDSQYVEMSNENVVETGYINDKNLAADYDPTATYSVGNYCMYHNELFVCTTDISVAEEWNGSKWQRISMSDIVGNVETLLAAI